MLRRHQPGAAPEHKLIDKWAPHLKNLDAVSAYRDEAARTSDFERTELAKDKTGVRLEGVTTWLLAPFVVWAFVLVAAILLPMVLFKKVLSEAREA